jgi:cysteine desulfurase/selenocysteine lyase
VTKSFAIQEIRRDFPNLSITVHGKPLVYLDNAATTLKPQCVIDRISEHYKKETSNVHRGVHYLSERATAEFEKVRGKICRFLNATHSSEIIFTKGTTDSINLVAHSYGRTFLQKGDEVIISEMEHHSNIVPWQMLREEKGIILKIIPIDDTGAYSIEDFQKLLTSQTKFVSLVYISNSLGTINPVAEIITLAHKQNIPVLLDGAQTVNHIPVDVQNLDCDFLVFSGHKLFGPTGVGVLYGKTDLLKAMPPYQGGGDMISSVTFEKTTYNVLPYKFEAGTPHIAGVIGLGAAIDYVTAIGFENIMSYEKDLLDYGTQALSKIPQLRLIGTAKHKASILSFVHPNIHAHDLGTLVDEQGIAIRTGHHCTQPVMKHFGVPATARASLTFYNTREDIDHLVDAIINANTIFTKSYE